MAEWLRAPAALPKDTGCSPKGSWVAGKLFLWSLWTWAYTPPPHTNADTILFTS